jgi:hypothetical protein
MHTIFSQHIQPALSRHSPTHWFLFWCCYHTQWKSQGRINAEKARLASTRVAETTPLAAAAAAVGGQALQRAITLQELLRRPHIHHR